MPEMHWPFAKDDVYKKNGRNKARNLLAILPSNLREACKETPFLLDYLEIIPIEEIGIPTFYLKLSRAMRDIEERNLIYPIGEGLFVHIYPNPMGARDYYVAIEPHTTYQLDTLLEQIEIRLVDWSEEIGNSETDEEKRQVLKNALDQILTTIISSGDNGQQRRERTESNKIYVTPGEMNALKYVIMRDKVGFGPLSPFLNDPHIEDISCSGIGRIYIEHKIFESVESTLSFPTSENLDEFVIWMSEWIKRPVTVRNPIVDSVLPDGSRINIVYGTDISKRGSNFTIRKFSETPISVFQLIEFGTLDYMMAAYLSLALEEDLNMFVVGATASGKTTTLNAITTFILPEAKIVTIEDTPELQVPHGNWIREMTRSSGREKTGSEVDMFDLLRAALRQRPNRIIIGEIRGVEGAIAFQAMQTGHGVMSTFHASNVEKLIQRLTGEPINIPKAYIDNLEVVVIQAAVKTPSGMSRRIVSINEIVGYDAVSKSFSVIEAFRWNPANDTFEFPGFMNSYVLEEKIALKKGIPPHKRRVIYTDLKRRAKIFERLHQERNLRTFDDVYNILAEAHRQHLL
ncbi:MAG: type II/IV secretion system ATPase subunit [Anaerolineales bacterium]|nr:type II/IV secretion system ATPase subunit [Anaerolineales bacterium]